MHVEFDLPPHGGKARRIEADDVGVQLLACADLDQEPRVWVVTLRIPWSGNHVEALRDALDACVAVYNSDVLPED